MSDIQSKIIMTTKDEGNMNDNEKKKKKLTHMLELTERIAKLYHTCTPYVQDLGKGMKDIKKI